MLRAAEPCVRLVDLFDAQGDHAAQVVLGADGGKVVCHGVTLVDAVFSVYFFFTFFQSRSQVVPSANTLTPKERPLLRYVVSTRLTLRNGALRLTLAWEYCFRARLRAWNWLLARTQVAIPLT